MILQLTLCDPFNFNYEIKLDIEYPNIDYMYFKNIEEYHDDKDLTNILEDIITDLDCTREISCGRILMTTYPMYNIKLSNYYFYLIKLQDQILYNTYLDRLINRHIDNLIFEYEHPMKQIIIKPSIKTKKKDKIPNKFVKQITNDLFTGEEIYIYENFKTGEIIESKNPDLLDELNAPKKKKKPIKIKTIRVPMEAMTFNFNKPKN